MAHEHNNLNLALSEEEQLFLAAIQDEQKRLAVILLLEDKLEGRCAE